MIVDSSKNGFDIVIVWKLDRFARNRYDSAHYKAQFHKNGVKVISATETISEGATMKEIVDIFNSRGIRTKRGKAITINAVTSMLHNRKHIGEYRFKNVVIPNGIPAIISKKLFDKVQTRMTTNKKAPAKHKSKDEYLLTTKLYCGKCKCLMADDSATSRTGTKYRYYKCPKVKYHRGCDKKNIK